MKKHELIELCKRKNYPDYFSRDLIILYPYMVAYYSEDIIDKFLSEWKYIFINNIGASGAAYRDRKEILVNEYNHHLWAYRIITATTHEVGHALGSLNIPTDTFLNDGAEFNDDFFTKMEEAIVSDYQDDLFRGELQYDYPEKYNYKCRGDIHHIENYAVQKLYYNIIKIILADKKNLCIEMMYQKDLRKKKEIFNEIMSIINAKLSPIQLKALMDSFAILIYNHGYSPIDSEKKYADRRKFRREQLYKSNYNMVISGKVSLEEYNVEFNTWFQSIYDDKYKRVKHYVDSNGISNMSVNEQCDTLCEMTIDYLTEQLEKMQDFDFDIVKATCIYFTKINNKLDRLNIKTQKLRKILYINLTKLEFNFCDEIRNNFSSEELMNIIIKLFSINNMTFETLSTLRIMKGNDNQDFIYVANGDCIIKIGRYSNLQNDDMKNNHDQTESNICVNTVIPEINLSYNKTIGDSNVNGNLQITDRLLCGVKLKERTVKK